MPFYPTGGGQATLLNTNTQLLLLNGERTGSGSPGKASIAVQLERQKAAFYPFGFSVELSFSGAPGTFEVDVQGSETDLDAYYCNLGSGITAVNSSNVGRFEGTTYYPKFVRVFVKTLGNDVLTTARISR